MGKRNVKYTLEEVRIIAKENGFELISDEYINSSTKLIFKDNEGYYYTSPLKNLMKNNKLDKFGIHNSYTIQNIKLWCELNNKPFKLLSNKYNGNKEKLKWKCLNTSCLEIFEMNWNGIKNKRGCSFCSGQETSLSNCLATKNPQLASEWHPTKNGDLTPYDVREMSNKRVFWICPQNSDHEWEAFISDRSRGCDCPICKLYKGEKIIDNFLELKSIKRKAQYKFSDCKYKNLLPFDFYLFDYNICIEYQGEGHYIPIDWSGKGQEWAEAQLLLIQKRDKIKRDYCNINNIKLIEIPYWDFNNIEQILQNELNTHTINNSNLTVVF